MTEHPEEAPGGVPIIIPPESPEPDTEVPPDDDSGPGVGKEYPPDPPMPEE